MNGKNNSNTRTYYDILGVNENATQEEIKKAFRKRSLKCHPDKGGDSNEFKELTNAYETLSNDMERKKYDMKLKGIPYPPSMNMHQHGGGVNINDEFLKQFFGVGSGGGTPFGIDLTNIMGGMGGNTNPNIRFYHSHTGTGNGNGGIHNILSKPPPILKTVDITFEQSFNGYKYPLEIERWILENGIKKNEVETIYIDIPEGIDNNEILILRERGNQHIVNSTTTSTTSTSTSTTTTTLNGDIKVIIKIVKEPKFNHFKRNGLDLYYEKTITLKEALCGFSFIIEYFNDRKFTINNKGFVITPNYTKVVPNLGLKRGGHQGNLFIKFNVTFPKEITPEKISQLESILE